MPRDIVILPSYYRPEFLDLCLDKLHQADGGPEKEVWIFQDRHTFDPPDLLKYLTEIYTVVERWKDKFGNFLYTEREPHEYRGNPLNIMEAYKKAFLQEDVRYVYMVEEDVLVCRDFFQWHEAIYTIVDPWVSVGWHCIRDTSGVKATTDPNAYVTSYRDFSSIGLCWKRENLESVVRHATPTFYANMGGYMAKTFPGSPVPWNIWTEQAGCVTRLLHEAPGERLVAWAGASRVSHVGVVGYHRKNGPKFIGHLDVRCKKLRAATRSTETMAALNNSKWEDIGIAVDNFGKWKFEDLYETQHVEYRRGTI